MALCFHHCLCLLYMVLITYLMMFLHLLYYVIIAVEIKGICIHHVNVILFFLVSFLPYIVDWSASCIPANLLEVLHLVSFEEFHSTCQAFSCLVAGSTVFSILLCGHFNWCMQFSSILLLFISYCLYLVKFFHLTQGLNDQWLGSLGLKSFCPC